jgi:Protein kinase domain
MAARCTHHARRCNAASEVVPCISLRRAAATERMLVPLEHARAGAKRWPQGDDVTSAAPEVLHALKQNQQVSATTAQDIWTLGVIAYETVTGCPVFPPGDTHSVFKCANAVAPYPWSTEPLDAAFAASRARAAIEGCLWRDPMARGSAQQVRAGRVISSPAELLTGTASAVALRLLQSTAKEMLLWNVQLKRDTIARPL